LHVWIDALSSSAADDDRNEIRGTQPDQKLLRAVETVRLIALRQFAASHRIVRRIVLNQLDSSS